MNRTEEKKQHHQSKLQHTDFELVMTPSAENTRAFVHAVTHGPIDRRRLHQLAESVEEEYAGVAFYNELKSHRGAGPAASAIAATHPQAVIDMVGKKAATPFVPSLRKEGKMPAGYSKLNIIRTQPTA
jgi:hypothetical protein